MDIKGQQLYLKPDESAFISMAVLSLIEQLQDTSKDERINWNPKSRKDLKEMLSAGTSLHIKMEKLGFDMRQLPPFIEGDENDFLTKQS